MKGSLVRLQAKHLAGGHKGFDAFPEIVLLLSTCASTLTVSQLPAVKSRLRAQTTHEAFEAQLARLAAKPDILDLYQEILSGIFRKNGADKGKQVKEVGVRIEKLKLRMANAQALMLDGEINDMKYCEIKASLC